ncbi:MAG: hypothetical protein AAF798_16170 [Bacteroidota bacterium]
MATKKYTLTQLKHRITPIASNTQLKIKGGANLTTLPNKNLRAGAIGEIDLRFDDSRAWKSRNLRTLSSRF